MEFTEDGKPIIIIGGKQPQASKTPLKVVNRNFKSFLKRSELPAKFVFLPEKLPELQFSPLEVIEQDFSNCGRLTIRQAVFHEGCWSSKSGSMKGVVPNESKSSFTGSNFVELEDGVYALSKDFSAGHRVTNATIRIVGMNRRIKADDSVEEILTCSIKCSDAWGVQCKELEVSSEDFKSLFPIIRKKFRDVFVLQSRSEILEEYLAEVNQRAFGENESSLRRKTTATVIGWSKLDGIVRYYFGDENFYSDYVIPMVNLEDRHRIFSRGFEFREIGHGDEVAEVL